MSMMLYVLLGSLSGIAVITQTVAAAVSAAVIAADNDAFLTLTVFVAAVVAAAVVAVAVVTVAVASVLTFRAVTVAVVATC